MNDKELGWLAGIFDGEGCLTVNHYAGDGHFEQWRATVAMSDEDVVRRFHMLIGIGTVRGPYIQTGAGRLPMWQWNIGRREDILNFCASLSPMMGERRTAKMKDCLAYLVP